MFYPLPQGEGKGEGDMKTLTLLGVQVHDVTYQETLEHIARFIAEGRSHQICTVNPEFIMTAQQDSEFKAILNAADLCVPDGVGLLWAANWIGQPLRERVTGSDLVPLLAAAAEARQWKVFFLGAAPGVADQAAAILKRQHPNLQVVGTWPGSPQPHDDDVTLSKIQAADPDIVLVAYGAPAQDKWIARNRTRLNAKVLMGVGGSFDFIAGEAERAPQWIQRLWLEWVHRLIKQPWRWRRMLAVPRFMWAIIWDQAGASARNAK